MNQLAPKSLFMAPMVDLSHEPYRQLVRTFSGCDLFYSEMLNSRMVPMENPEKAIYLKADKRDDLIMQLIGNDPEKMARAALKIDTLNPWGIDINMGCSLKKVTCHGWGAALMKDIKLAGEIVRSVKKSVNRPVSVKTRIGWTNDKDRMIEFGLMLQDAGADFIVLHARTVPELMQRSAHWEYIGNLKDALKIPVIGNGDIKSVGDALKMIAQTGCDGVMIGRQGLTTPWIFRDIKSTILNEAPPEAPDLKTVIFNMANLIQNFFEEDIALKRFKAAVFWLSKNLAFGHFLSKEVNKASTFNEAILKIKTLFADGIS